jgi:hypothetical protein
MSDRCPECGCKDFVNKNLVGEGYRQCKQCEQDWWTDIIYTSYCKGCCREIFSGEYCVYCAAVNNRDCPHGHQLGKCDTCDLIEAEKRIAEQDAEIKKLKADIVDMVQKAAAKHRPAYDEQQQRIAQLEAAAKAAMPFAVKNWIPYGERLFLALRAAGYLLEQGNE